MRRAGGLWESVDLSFRDNGCAAAPQIRFGRMFTLNELWVLMVEERSRVHVTVLLSLLYSGLHVFQAVI